MRPSLKIWIVAGIAFVVVLVIGISVSRKTVNPVPVTTPAASSQYVSPNHRIIGHSVEGRNIEAFTYQSAKSSPDAKHLLFVGGVHGGYEWNTVLLAYSFMDYFEANPSFIGDNLVITIIPSANPDGVYRVTGKQGRFTVADVSTDAKILASGRFNGNDVDLNRNFDCKWQAKGTWQTREVSGGTKAFSEPESQTIRDFIANYHPEAAIFWHSQSNGVFASQCGKGILPVTLDLMNAYSKASSYPAIKSFDAYTTTGAADDWLSTIGIPAITVELQTHSSIEWERNLAGIKAVLEYFKR